MGEVDCVFQKNCQMRLKATKDTHAWGSICILCSFKERLRSRKSRNIHGNNEKEHIPQGRK